MADFKKIGLLYLSDDQTKFLACEKDNFTSDFIMPGGQLEEGENDFICLKREIKEELGVELDQSLFEFVGEYTDVAAGDLTKDVMIRLYRGMLIGDPKPSSEIKLFHWLTKEDVANARLSPIIRNKILPDLIARKILK